MAFEQHFSVQSGFPCFTWTGNLLEKNQINETLLKAEHYATEGKTKWLFNLSALQHLNSSGLNALIQLLTKARNAGGEAVLYGLNYRTRDILTMTKLVSIFTVVDTVEDAIDFLNSI